MIAQAAIAEVVRQLIGADESSDVATMLVVAAIVLVGNVATLRILCSFRARAGIPRSDPWSGILILKHS